MSKIKIIVAVACLLLACGIFYFTMLRDAGGGLGSSDTNIWFKCVNPQCNAAYSLKSDEFAKLQGNNPMMPMMMPGQQQAFACQKCSQQTAYMAQQCEKCKEVFVMQMAMPAAGETSDFTDRCPKCGYSSIEEMEKTQK